MAQRRKTSSTKEILGTHGQGIHMEQRRVVTSTVAPDGFTDQVKGWFDIPFDGTSTFECWSKPAVADFSIGLIIGPSGSGKSLLLKEFGQEESLFWEKGKAIVSHFSDP